MEKKICENFLLPALAAENIGPNKLERATQRLAGYQAENLKKARSESLFNKISPMISRMFYSISAITD